MCLGWTIHAPAGRAAQSWGHAGPTCGLVVSCLCLGTQELCLENGVFLGPEHQGEGAEVLGGPRHRCPRSIRKDFASGKWWSPKVPHWRFPLCLGLSVLFSGAQPWSGGPHPCALQPQPSLAFSLLPPCQDLKKYGATTVVRVCEVTYDKAPLEKDGITVVVRAGGAGGCAAAMGGGGSRPAACYAAGMRGHVCVVCVWTHLEEAQALGCVTWRESPAPCMASFHL